MEQFTRIDFRRFKAFSVFQLHLRHFNILVGPNNSGKSTILTAFRILAAAMRKAMNRKAEIVRGPAGQTHGYAVDLGAVSVAEENIFYNYDNSEAAAVQFTLSSGNELLLYFPTDGGCNLIVNDPTKAVTTPTAFRSRFACPIGFVPILGPVEHNEELYEKDAARLALFNYRAARNFRNIWYHYPEKFQVFRNLLRETWPGMDIEAPTLDSSYAKPRLHMFCPEERIPREIFWAGFGFQVWCQMLTHMVQSSDKALFLIDEPDIYLHSDLQRQLLGLLRNLGPDILIATHSTEIITEAEPDDIVLVNKHRRIARRIKEPMELAGVFRILGSNLNPILTQLAKTRRAVFVEGKDFQVVGRFARKCGFAAVGNRTEFAVIPVEGFNPDRIRSLKRGIEQTLGGVIRVAAILDRDYRSDDECRAITEYCETFCDLVTVHECKEIENFLLVPAAIDRAAARRVADRAKRAGTTDSYDLNAASILESFANEKKSYVCAQYVAARRAFERSQRSGQHEATFNKIVLDECEAKWNDSASRLRLVPGKEALSVFNQQLQSRHDVNVTPTAIIDAMQKVEVSTELIDLLEELSEFADNNVER